MFLGSEAKNDKRKPNGGRRTFFCFKNRSVETLLRKISSCDHWSLQVKDDTPTDVSCLVGIRESEMMKENPLHSCMGSVRYQHQSTFFLFS